MKISRRCFLSASGCLAAGFSLWACATVSIYRASVSGDRISLDASRFPELSEPGGGIVLKAEGLRDSILLVNDGGRLQALSAVCTHLGCNVRPAGRLLVCPCHGSTYSLDGRVTRGPAARALSKFETQTRGDRVEIFISR
jgi:Rieske Fe-S protein